MIAPWMRSPSFTRDSGSRYMVELPDFAPPFFQAFLLTKNSWSRLSVFSANLSKTMICVMILLMLAGAIGSSGFFSYMDLPVRPSIRIAFFDLVKNCSCSGETADWAWRGPANIAERAIAQRIPKILRVVVRITGLSNAVGSEGDS